MSQWWRVTQFVTGTSLITSSSTPRGVVAVVKSEAVGDTKDVRVDGKGRFVERGRHHDAGRLAADAGERLERLAVARNSATVVVHDRAGGGDDVRVFILKKPHDLMIFSTSAGSASAGALRVGITCEQAPASSC